MTRLNWQTVGLIAVLSAVAVALASLTEWSPAEILGLLGLLAGIGGGAVITGAVSGRVDQLQADTAAQTKTLDKVAHRVNGELDQRIADGVRQGNNDLLAQLRAEGVIR